jgi:murein DD-endopeptidase MepM/ murein hydrolase activator NlpD
VKSLGSLTATALLSLAAAAPALAADASSAQGGTNYAGTNGGATYGEPTVTKPKAPKKKPVAVSARPRLVSFGVAPAVLTPGQAPTISFQVKGRAPTIRLRLVVSWPESTTTPSRTINLGRLPANAPQNLTLTQLADPALPEGQMSIRIAGRDSAGRILRPGAHLSRVAQVQVRGHVFPLRGEFSYGTAANHFGAGRNGHTHQGQDLLAAEGLPVVAPRAGTVEYVEYQKGGAGWYVVLDGDGEEYDYAFMHLQEGSIPVVKGEHVDQGQRLGSVGHTGDAVGDHLHFEIWQGQWWGQNSQPIDPLPFLQQWQLWSPVRAI